MHSEFYRICRCSSSMIHSENISPNSGFSNEEIGVYLEKGVIDFDKEISAWEIIFAVICDDRNWRVWASVCFFWRLGCHGGLR